MIRPVPTRASHAFLPLLGALLWGAVELVALARSRWSLRSHDHRRT